MEKKEPKFYSAEAVDTALLLTAKGCTGLLHPENAKEELSKLPEELAGKVMAATMAAIEIRNKVISNIIKSKLEEKAKKEGEKSEKESEEKPE